MSAVVNEKTVLQPNAHISAHQGRLRNERHLILARRQHRPVIAFRAKQAIGRPLHEHEIVEIGPDSAHDAENELDEEWRLHQPLIDEIGQIVEMADVIAFMLELATLSSHCLKYISYILERVPEDIVVAAENIGLLPIMLPTGDALGRIARSDERRGGKGCVSTCNS